MSGRLRLADLLGGLSISTYGGTGHCPHWEQPERTAAEIAAFVAEAASQRDELAWVD